jgi:hypothetical protein
MTIGPKNDLDACKGPHCIIGGESDRIDGTGAPCMPNKGIVVDINRFDRVFFEGAHSIVVTSQLDLIENV